jgi:2-oxoglutarate ferredoxin oxidoreductase subunit alpha
MSRTSLKIVGSSGQGINSIGEILAKGLKRSGYCVFGYREYPSLIKGGHASYQLDVDATRIRSTETKINILVCLNHHGLELNLHEVKDGGIVLHVSPDWKFSAEQEKDLKKRKISVINFPVNEILTRLAAKPILANVILSAFVWASLGQDEALLTDLVCEKFAKKPDLLELNRKCIQEGAKYTDPKVGKVTVKLPKPDKKWAKDLLITGSQAMGLGTIHAGVRLYAGYPMTPSSPLLSFISELQNHTGMVIKQAEDEITAAQIVSGAMFAGTRALTATSGGGFDLMSETLSLNAIIENPTVFVLAQRPGPATGLPTWTAQSDLLMAINTSHGEFARCVLAVSDSTDAFHLMNDAFNIAEEFQISVIVLTDKQIAEALYTQAPFDQSKTKLNRGSKLVTSTSDLKKLKSADRYDVTVKDGISKRWLPGSEAASYCAQGDEHDSAGNVNEGAVNAKQQIDKRLRKMDALKKSLPEPELFGAKNPEILLVGWGSTKDAVLDVLESVEMKDAKIGYLHYTYLWPLQTQTFEKLHAKAKKTVLIEGNATGQLGTLLRQECGVKVETQILKYDGRPFFYDELLSLVQGPLKRS